MSYKRGVHNSSRNRTSTGLSSGLSSKPARVVTGSIALMVKRIREDADRDAQHGPVKVLWRNGKPVTGQQP